VVHLDRIPTLIIVRTVIITVIVLMDTAIHGMGEAGFIVPGMAGDSGDGAVGAIIIVRGIIPPYIWGVD
jgi:hypothetical protein